MKNRLSDSNVVEVASTVALVYVATQAVVAGVRGVQFGTAAVKEFRKARSEKNVQDES